MWERLRGIDKAVHRVSYWGGFLAALWGGLTWVWSKTTAWGAVGWPEAILYALATTCAVVLVIATGLSAWRLFSPLVVSENTSANPYSILPQQVETIQTFFRKNKTTELAFNKHKFEAGIVINPPITLSNVSIFVHHFLLTKGDFATPALPIWQEACDRKKLPSPETINIESKTEIILISGDMNIDGVVEVIGDKLEARGPNFYPYHKLEIEVSAKEGKFSRELIAFIPGYNFVTLFDPSAMPPGDPDWSGPITKYDPRVVPRGTAT